MKIDIYTLLGLIKDGKAPKKIAVYGDVFEINENARETKNIYVGEDGDTLFDDYWWSLNDEVEIIDEEDKKIEIPQEFLADVNSESEIVLIKDDIGHDYGYKNSVGFITSRSSMGECFIFAFDKRANRWWSCRFDKDEYIRTGLFVSDLFKPFVTLTPSKEDEFIDIGEWKISDYYKCDDYQLIRDNFEIVNKQINDLIKNQKKIIQALKENK